MSETIEIGKPQPEETGFAPFGIFRDEPDGGEFVLCGYGTPENVRKRVQAGQGIAWGVYHRGVHRVVAGAVVDRHQAMRDRSQALAEADERRAKGAR